MTPIDLIQRRLDEHRKLAAKMNELLPEIEAACRLVVDTFRAGGKLLLSGNGGSAADAQHWAAEWVIRLSHVINRPSLPAIALSTDSSVLTAGANDIGYDNVFARQVEGLAARGDLLVAISTSGNSENVIRAAKMARDKRMKVLGILGKGGGKLAPFCDRAVIIPTDDIQRVQEMHVFVGHMLCEVSEEMLFGDI